MIPGIIPRMPPPSILSTVTRCLSSDSLGVGDTCFFIAAMDFNMMNLIHPGSQPQSNGLRAAIRRPDIDGYQPLSSKITVELKKRNKSNHRRIMGSSPTGRSDKQLSIFLGFLGLYSCDPLCKSSVSYICIFVVDNLLG
ncbi:uncharacterized protein HKW66_Vig0127770 [Vigna angularis]|uniref:Uncharacterized protein n=1 Tax=Phaseolus angularis TaxID=3914 RepID=A0A8T0K5F9_PHAAN|nr:uncharacterized protein HKW66_Vig0127770 [Vigna angularis]